MVTGARLILADSAGLLAVDQHPSWVLLALPSSCPIRAVPMVVRARRRRVGGTAASTITITIHEVDLSYISCTESVSLPNPALVSGVFRLDGQPSVPGEEFPAIMHHGVVIIGRPAGVDAGGRVFVEVVFVSGIDVRRENGNEVVTIGSALLVE